MSQSFQWRIPRLFVMLVITLFYLTGCTIPYDPRPVNTPLPPPPVNAPDPFHTTNPKYPARILQVDPPAEPTKLIALKPSADLDRLVNTLSTVSAVASRFKKSEFDVFDVFVEADKHSYSDFPKRDDILAVIAVESAYNKSAHYRGSWGLMQIELRSHKTSLKGRDIKNVAVNIEVGAKLLRENYLALKHSNRSAFLAYNAGIGAFLKGKSNPAYYRKIREELKYLSSLS